MTDDWAVRASGLTKSYGDVQVLTGLDLQVAPATVFALLGPNGAGKTTTVRILSTLTRADSGTAQVVGLDVVRDRAQVRRRISLTGQYAAVDMLQTGRENLMMMGRLTGLDRRAAKSKAVELLDRFNLSDAAGRQVGTYSGGMKRRLDLAASLVGNASMVFLDEPTTGLDPRSRQEMWTVITGLVESGVTVFLTTQYLEEADRLADRIAVVDHGQVIAEGTAAELKAQVSQQRLDLTMTDSATFSAAVDRLGGQVVHRDDAGRTVSTATDGSAAHIRAVLDDLDPSRTAVAHFALHSATLDDVFLTLTGKSVDSELESTNV
ncbi:MAG: ATP-binding cassette domain-containing protein [Jatrophihabitans sp.]